MKIITNQNGFTYILALTVVMIMGIMLGMVGQSWKTIMRREREKELIFRGSQIKEAIENWYNLKYFPGGAAGPKIVTPLLDLNDLLEGGKSATKNPYLPHSYAAKLDTKNPRCGSECASQKIYQDPMTGKEWNIIKCDVSYATHPICMMFPGTNTIIGVASKSNEEPFKMDFKDTALENMGVPVVGTTQLPPGSGGRMGKYSEWKFVVDPQNDHSKIYRAYHEGW